MFRLPFIFGLRLVLILIIPSHACFGQSDDVFYTHKYAPEELREDATVMKNAILKIHPVIGIYHDKSYYEKLFDEFTASLTDSLTERQFRFKVKQVLNKMQCGHTDVISSKKYLKEIKKHKYNAQKYFFLPSDSGVYVLSGLMPKKDTLLKPGWEVVRINGVKPDSIFRMAQEIITTDGHINASKTFFARIGFSTYTMFMLDYPDTVAYEIKQGKQTKTIKIPSFKTKNFPFYKLHLDFDSLYTKYKKADMKFRYLDEEHKSFYLKLNSFSHKKFTKAYHQIFRKISKSKCENLVIDLRDNGGGSMFNSYELMKYLLPKTEVQTSYTFIKGYPYKKYTKGSLFFRVTRMFFSVYGKHHRNGDTNFYALKIKPKKRHHYNGKIYVLINEGSFSASCLVGAYLKANCHAEFIGQETGGTLEGSNAVITPYYKLPNTKVKVRIPAFRLEHDAITGPFTGRGIIPDYPITYQFRDFQRHRDLEMKKVEELLGIKKPNPKAQ